MKILIAAGNWGYGPASTGITLSQALSVDNVVDFFGNDISAQFMSRNSGCINELLKSLEVCDYDLVISVLEPSAIIFAKENKVSCVYIDNIYWYWSWSEEDIKVVESIKFDGNRSDFLEYLYAYVASDYVYLQRLGDSRNFFLEDKFREKIKHFDLMKPLFRKRTACESESKMVLLSFSGFINPNMTQDKINIYVRIVYAILSEKFESISNDCQIVIAAPEQAHKIINELFSMAHKVCEFSHDEFLSELDKCSVVIAPAGMSTISESVFLEKKMIFLPEQHNLTYSNYTSVFGVKNNNYSLMFSGCVEGFESYSDDEIFSFYSELDLCGEVINNLGGKAGILIDDFLNDNASIKIDEYSRIKQSDPIDVANDIIKQVMTAEEL